MGLLVDYELDRFILINKGFVQGKLGNPLKWCGVGGKIKSQEELTKIPSHPNSIYATTYESPHEAMEREFREETRYQIKKSRWHCFHIKEYNQTVKIYMFVAFGPTSELERIKGIDTGEGIIGIHTMIDVLFDSHLYTFDLPYILAMVFREMRAGFFMKLDPEGINSSAKNT